MHPKEKDLVRFRDAEQVILEYLERFQDKYLNTVAPFNRMNPSIENFLDYTAGDIDLLMKENDWVVKELRISENPTRTYMIDRQRMDEVREQVDVAAAENVMEAVAEAAATAEITEVQTEESIGTDVETVIRENESAEHGVKAKEAESQVVSKLLVDTEDLRVKTQTTSNMMRIVITIP